MMIQVSMMMMHDMFMLGYASSNLIDCGPLGTQGLFDGPFELSSVHEHLFNSEYSNKSVKLLDVTRVTTQECTGWDHPAKRQLPLDDALILPSGQHVQKRLKR